MKKIFFGLLLLFLFSFSIKKIPVTPAWRLMLTSEIIIKGKVLSHDTTAIVVEVAQVLSTNSKSALTSGQKIKINNSNNSKISIKTSRTADGVTAIFYLNTTASSTTFNHTDRFLGSVPLNLEGKIQFYNGIDYKNYGTLQEYIIAIKQVKKSYLIDETGKVQSKLSKKSVYKTYKMSAIATSIFNEIERERSNYSNQ